MGAGSALLAVFALVPITRSLGVLPEYTIGRKEMAVRAEYYTEGGKYLGGLPRYDEHIQGFECTRFNSDSSSSSTTDGVATTTTTDGSAVEDATVCLSWTANEMSEGVRYEVGRCSCQSVANAEYCEEWTCGQLGSESARCTCEAEDGDSKRFCSSWTCVQTDSDGAQDVGEYQCVTASNSSGFCETWRGEIQWPTTVQVSSCACAEQWRGVNVCRYWECKELNLGACSDSEASWCDMGVSLGVGGLLGSFGAMGVAFGVYRLNQTKFQFWLKIGIASGIAWMGVWSPAVVIWGGQDGAVFVGIWWGVVVASGLFCRFHRDRVTECLARCRDCSGKRLAACRDCSSKRRGACRDGCSKRLAACRDCSSKRRDACRDGCSKRLAACRDSSSKRLATYRNRATNSGDKLDAPIPN